MVRKLTALLLIFLMTGFAFGTTYYVDSSGGNDGNTGTSQVAAWQNLAKVNSITFSPGDTVVVALMDLCVFRFV